MLLAPTKLQGVVTFKPNVLQDDRGFFIEGYRASYIEKIAPGIVFIQDNHARSEKAGVLRGLHYQAPPVAQAKFIWVTRGAVFDVVVDLRKGSPTYGEWEAFSLSADNFIRLFIPKGFAHGYLTLEPGTEVQYKVDAYYAPDAENGIAWNDPDMGIPWPERNPILSEKDKKLPLLRNIDSPFNFF